MIVVVVLSLTSEEQLIEAKITVLLLAGALCKYGIYGHISYVVLYIRCPKFKLLQVEEHLLTGGLALIISGDTPTLLLLSLVCFSGPHQSFSVD